MLRRLLIDALNYVHADANAYLLDCAKGDEGARELLLTALMNGIIDSTHFLLLCSACRINRVRAV